ncbi:hypothetical protein [Cohnella sp. AR92]|uniref:hypothetical protein n=1 Tax=Cohnella sp. AR92 TaxID=648716 RepID=UPI000F8E8B68|nr:hypothetical protein [Cohnella sp. AR92]RUS44897.1 hypothetical protein ELR57_21815 [Cohnella sp. AR92]
MNKKIAALIFVFSLVFSSSAGVLAGTKLTEIKAYLNGDIKFEVNGEAWTPKDASGKTILPITYEGITYIPLRAAASALSTDINYNSTQKKISIGSETKNKESTPSSANSTDMSDIEKVINYFSQNGFIVGETSEKYYQLVGAKDGLAVEINGQKIELYQYDPSQLSIVKDKIIPSNKNPEDFPMLLNGEILLAFPEPTIHPDKEMIVAFFKELKL